MSFRMRVALFGAAVVALTIVLLSLLLYGLVRAGAPRDRDRLLLRLAREGAAQAQTVDPAVLRPGRTLGAVDLRGTLQPFMFVLGPNGEVFSATAELDGR